MPRMTLKSTISNSTISSEVTFLESVTGKFLYTLLDINLSPTEVEIEKGFERLSGLTFN